MTPRPVRDEAYWQAMVAKQLESAPPLGIEQARRIVALMWPHGLPHATTTTRKKAS